jgi:hypothetical protein
VRENTANPQDLLESLSLVTDTLSVHGESVQDESITIKRHGRGMNHMVHTEGVRYEQDGSRRLQPACYFGAP